MIKPSDLQRWEDIDQSKASLQATGGHPEWYAWFKHKSGIFYAHRKPSISEMYKDVFN